MCGCLQAEGCSSLVGAIEIGSLVVNMLGFDSAGFLVFKRKTIGGAFVTILSELIHAVILCAVLLSAFWCEARLVWHVQEVLTTYIASGDS